MIRGKTRRGPVPLTDGAVVDRVSVRAARWTTAGFSAAAVWDEREARLAAASG